MAKTSISIRLDPELGDQLSTVAARLDRPNHGWSSTPSKSSSSFSYGRSRRSRKACETPMTGEWCRVKTLSPGWSRGAAPTNAPYRRVRSGPQGFGGCRGPSLSRAVAGVTVNTLDSQGLAPRLASISPLARDATEPPPVTPPPPLGAERVGVRWGIPPRLPAPISPSPLPRNGSPPSPP
jgi:hypothetical protein